MLLPQYPARDLHCSTSRYAPPRPQTERNIKKQLNILEDVSFCLLENAKWCQVLNGCVLTMTQQKKIFQTKSMKYVSFFNQPLHLLKTNVANQFPHHPLGTNAPSFTSYEQHRASSYSQGTSSAPNCLQGHQSAPHTSQTYLWMYCNYILEK